VAEVLAAALGVLCYLNVLPNDFTYDAVAVVQHNPLVNEPGRWGDIWTKDLWWAGRDETPRRDLLYRPVTLSSYRLVRLPAGGDPWPQHALNLALHALICVLVVRLCRQVVPESDARGRNRWAPLLAGAGFAVLPIHTDVVANLVGRADLLATLGVLLTLACHRRVIKAVAGLRDRSRDRQGAEVCHERPDASTPVHPAAEVGPHSAGARRWVWMLGAAAAAFLSMGAKESGVSVVLLAPLFDALERLRRREAGALTPAPLPRGEGFRRRTPGAGGETPLPGGEGRVKGEAACLPPSSACSPVPGKIRPWVADWWSLESAGRLAYLAVPLLVYFALRYHALAGQLLQKPALTKTVNVLVDAPAWQHVLGVVQLWGMYWTKTFWPATLCIDYSIHAVRLARSVFDAHVLIGLAVLGGLLVAATHARRRGRPEVAVLAGGLVVSYLPTSNALVLIQVFFAERIWYLPSVFVVVLLAWAVAGWVRRPAGAVAAGLIVLTLLGRCWVRNFEWRDNGTLFAAAWRDHPDSVGARYLYGQWLTQHGQYEDGVRLLESALDIDLGLTDAHRALGRAHLEHGDYQRAVQHLRIAHMQVPGHPATEEAMARAGAAYAETLRVQLEEARSRATQAPADLSAQVAYVELLLQLGQHDEALLRLRQDDARFAEEAPWQTLKCRALVQAGELDEAIDAYARAHKLAPEDAGLLVEWAMLLLERRRPGDLDEAQELLAQAGGLAPDDPRLLVGRAELTALRGDLTTALRLYQAALQRVAPDSVQHRVWRERARTLGG